MIRREEYLTVLTRATITETSTDGFWIEIQEYAPGWCYPWELTEDGWRTVSATGRKTIEEAETAFDNLVKFQLQLAS